ncbi:site-specific tyrosine recombinase XerC [Serratia ficaria]|uniref:tyrosine-type recombinase/integrase n=1 Tax=Serratia ficaria TaxID=61651 RepID=UPI00217C2C5C|nr:tyrosine-type recombinase/integrase [Serratia ficaria]CAI1190209.1 site-specific tyrosine recombinase XerC [Serratia ficaria]CAI2000384.1 site-specific tyrosine recombinase XerC [Serratia ficaria]CAI2463927.1 site-specific tyrosine recombinase XerC [Serratia ficaria]CAI2539464.1 site-specific tyrosine recombinase XerC [Serratia ficaria]
MGNSARNQYLYRHESGIWMFQIAVPQHMRHLTNGRRLFRKSTGQRDVQKARTVRDRLIVEWNHVKEKHAVDTETITLNRAINAVQQLGQVSAAASGNRVMLQAVTSEYLAEYKKTRSPSTLSKHALAVRLLLGHLAVVDTEITGITRTSVTQFIRALKPKKSAQTIQNYLSGLNSVYEYARRCYDGIPAASPFTGHRLEAKRTVSSYQPFTQAEIATLLDNTIEDVRDVIFIGLYSGMRLNEIASLGVDDVPEIDGVRCFRVQAAKTKAGVRLVPVHPALIGIIEKYKQQNTNGQHGRYLLPKANAIKRADAKRGPWFSQQFTRLRNKVLPNATDRQCFHSLRGMFITELDRTGVPEDRIALIVGHERGKTESFRTYSGGAELAELSKIVQLVNYKGR